MKKEKIIKSVDLRKTLKGYENKWVALETDHKKVVASGDSLNQTILQVKKKNLNKEKISFTKVFPFGISYAPRFL